jgi:hypothetical protein
LKLSVGAVAELGMWQKRECFFWLRRKKKPPSGGFF